MANVTYNALRELVAGHTANTQYSLDFPIRTVRRTKTPQGLTQTSNGGQVKRWHSRTDLEWDVTPVFRRASGTPSEIQKFREFLASVEAGELFTFDLMGSAVSPDSPVNAVLVGGWSENPISAGQLWNLQFKVRVVP